MYYILSSSTVSHQNTFGKKGFSQSISPLSNSSELIQPNYKDYIDPTMLRRTSAIIRMSISCSLDCLKQSEIKQPEAIIVGTGLGCLFDTEKFLDNVLTANDSMISPTSFIQSTHNTIAGQLSIILKNHSYNMTHTQNTLSFEHALQDGMLCLNEGKQSVLVGAADEYIAILDDISKLIFFKEHRLTSGASFFMLSKKKSDNVQARITATATYGGISSSEQAIDRFCRENGIKPASIDRILYSSMEDGFKTVLEKYFKVVQLIDFQKYCGIYFSNSAFGVQLAADMLEHKNDNSKKILVCNNLHGSNLGLTLIESIET